MRKMKSTKIKKIALVVAVMLFYVSPGLVLQAGAREAPSLAAVTAQKESLLAEWPEDFGPAFPVVKGHSHQSYRAVTGPSGSIWCFVTTKESLATQGRPGGKPSSIGLVRIAPDLSVSPFTLLVSVHGDLIDLDVDAGEDRVVLVWVEKDGDVFHLYSVSLREKGGSGMPEIEAGPKVRILDAWTTVLDVAVAVSGSLNVYGWIDQEEGRPGVFLGVLDAGEEASTGDQALKERIRVSAEGVSASTLRLAPFPGGALLTWVECKDVTYEMMFRSYRNGSLGPPLQVGSTTGEEEYGVVPFALQSGNAALVYTKGVLSRGRIARPCVAYAEVTPDGEWLCEPLTISGGEGFALAPSIAIFQEKTAIAWADNREGRLGIYWAEYLGEVNSTSAGSPAHYGAVTYSTKECLSPRIFYFPDGTPIVLYLTYENDNVIQVYAASGRNPRPPDWKYYLRLDPLNPVTDGLFKTVNAIGASLALTFVSFPSLAVGLFLTALLDKFGIFSKSEKGSLLALAFLFGSIFFLKEEGKWYYLFAPCLPAGLSWVSFALSGGFSLLFTRQVSKDLSSVLARALSGVLFVFFDTLFSVIQKGVGVF